MGNTYKKRRSNDYYSPSYSILTTYRSIHEASFLDPKITMSKYPSNSILTTITNSINYIQGSDITQGDPFSFFYGIQRILSDTTKSLWNWITNLDNGIESKENQEISNQGREIKKRATSETSFIQNKKLKSSRDHNIFMPIYPKTLIVSKQNNLQGQLKCPGVIKNYKINCEKDPFKWDVNANQISIPDDLKSSNVNIQYGMSFYKRKQGFINENKRTMSHESVKEIEYLKMVFNGQYQPLETIEDKRREQLKLLDDDRNKDINLKRSIINLTEKIKHMLANKSNPSNRFKNDDLVFIKEKKIEPLKTHRKNFYAQKLQFDRSILTFEGEFKTYKGLINEHKKVQEEVRKAQKKQNFIPDLHEKDIDEISYILKRSDNSVLFNKHNLEVTVRDFKTLAPKRWLNDTIIEFFVKHIELKIPNIVGFNSFFYSNLSQKGYQGVRRWMKRKKVVVVDLDKIFAPINLNQSHWALGMIDISNKKIVYVDSLSTVANSVSFTVMKDLQTYIIEETKGELGKDFELVHIDCPQQPNGFDCGIYVCMNLLYLSNNANLTFNYDDISKMRNYICHLILSESKN